MGKLSFDPFISTSLKKEEIEYAPLYDKNGSAGSTDGDLEHTARPRSSRTKFAWFWKCVSYLTVFLLGVLVAYIVPRIGQKKLLSQRMQALPRSPAQHVAKYEERVGFDMNDSTGHISGWNGPPTNFTEYMWKKYSEEKTMILSEEELLAAGEDLTDAVRMKDGNYLALLGVFHELHCIEEFRWYVHRDYYYPNQTKEEEEYMKEHLDHCFDILRLSTMCTGDLTAYTFRMVEQEGKTRLNSVSTTKRQCLVLDPVVQWVRDKQKGHEAELGLSPR